MEKISYKLITACSFGAILEWYDFTVYAYLAPVIATLFFPHENHVTSIVLAYSVFAIGFLARPLGAILFGHFGDRVGRKKVLVYSIVLIASSTALIGVLPTYSEVGLLAPVFLVLLRILQGLTIGGEVTGAGSFVIESTPTKRRGFATSIIWASSGVGMLLSSIVVATISLSMSHDALSHWGWRLPFLLGSVTGVVGYYLRKNISESSEFKQVQQSADIVKFPLVEAIKKVKTKIVVAAGIYVLSAIITYLIFVYMPVYASKTIGLPFAKTMTINTVIMAFMIVLVPIFGHYSDIFARRKMLLVSSTGIFLLAFPLYVLIGHGSVVDLIIAQVIFAIVGAAYQGAITRTVLEMFATNVRYSAAGFAYNLTYSLFGGMAPMVAVFLVDKLKFNAAPSLYLIFGAVISFIAVLNLE